MEQCKECGTYGTWNSVSKFVSADWITMQSLREQLAAKDAEIIKWKSFAESETRRRHLVATENERLREAVLRGISALNWLPEDKGPIRKQASDAITFMRQVLSTAKGGQ